MTNREFAVSRWELEAFGRRAKRDSYEILLSALELPLGLNLLFAALVMWILPTNLARGLFALSGLPMWYGTYRLYCRYRRQLGTVKPPTSVLVNLCMTEGIFVFPLLLGLIYWLDRSYPQLVDTFRQWGFRPIGDLTFAVVFFIPLGVRLRIWRWVANSLWIVLGLGGLLLALPELEISRFVHLSFFITGIGFTLSGAVFLREAHRRHRALPASQSGENNGQTL